MITKRKFAIMTVMMFVLFFMFQFSQVMKEAGNEYDRNEFASDATEDSSGRWTANPTAAGEDGGRYVVLVGDATGDVGNTAAQWCEYTKRRLVVRSSVAECPSDVRERAELVLLEANHVTGDEELGRLIEMAEGGMSLVFCNLPDQTDIAASEAWRKLLGIKEVKASQVVLSGVNLFSGFLLGGQGIYEAKDEEEMEERQDLELYVPWYQTGDGCKTYMVGLLGDPSVKNENLPALIWRAGIGDGKVFCISGTFMSDCTGIGMLDAIVAELNPYTIYPVVNAQCLSVANFPGFADENRVDMELLYSRRQLAVIRDILWPGLCSMIEKSGAHLTCYLAPQSDYEDEAMPQAEQLIFYLKEMREKGAEAGLSLDYAVAADGLTEKLMKDEAFFRLSGSSYRYGAAYLPPDYSGGTTPFRTFSLLRNILTVSAEYKKEYPVITYLTKEITRQSITSTGISHTYADDIRMKSLQTALGYSNIALDMSRVTWPDEEDDRWEVLAEKFSSNINTYWRAFEMFDQTSASESDRRIRTFLGMDYEYGRTGDDIWVRVQKGDGDAWFILRTHGEKIVSVDGGDFERIETDAYLIRIPGGEATIHCERTDALYYRYP